MTRSRTARRALAIYFASLLLASCTRAGPGLLVQNADDYYKPPLRRTLHSLESIPAFPPEEMRLPFREQDLFELREAGYFEGYRGRDWNRTGPVNRYDVAYLLGGFLTELDRVYGVVFRHHKYGPRGLLLPPGRYGRARVRTALSEKLLTPKPSQVAWWEEAPDRYQAAKWVSRLLTRMEPRVTLLVDPSPIERTLTGDMLYYGHPMRRRVRRALETRVMTAPYGRFRGRERLSAREWVRIINRLRFVVHGYRRREAEPSADAG